MDITIHLRHGLHSELDTSVVVRQINCRLDTGHVHNGKIMTGKSHTKSSKDLYHFMDLSPEAKRKVLSKKK